MADEPGAARPLPLYHHADDWFRRARTSLLDALPCGPGCHTCCIGIFPITRLDALEIQRGLAALPTAQRDAMTARARSHASTLEAAYPLLTSTRSLDGWTDAALDQLAEQFAETPCPALNADGTCGIYVSRPLTCRTMGIPDEINGLVHGACRTQTAVPIVRLPAELRQEMEGLAEEEAAALSIVTHRHPDQGEELLLPYGFLPHRKTAGWTLSETLC